MKHPNEQAYMDFARQTMTEEYLKMLAQFIKDNYPGSAEKVLPVLRQIYKEKFKNEKRKTR